MNLLKKVRSYMLGTDYEEEELLEDEYDDDEMEEEIPRIKNKGREKENVTDYSISRLRRTSSDSKVVALPVAHHSGEARMKVAVCRPEVVDDAASICDFMKDNVMCVVILEGIDRANAQRIADFLGGVSYSMSGDIQRISNDIFLIAPTTIGILSEVREELKSRGLILPWISHAFK